MPSFSFTYDPRLRSGAGGYRDNRTGRVTTSAQVRFELDTAIDKAQLDTRGISLSLRDGAIDLREWETSMRRAIKNSHIAAAVSQRGGWDQMTQSDWGRVGQRIRTQYGFLDRFSEQIASGKQPLDGRFLVRAQMYDESAISTYDKFERNDMRNAGFDEQRSILERGVNHCSQCPEEADKGWQPIGGIVPIGERVCLTRCRCTMEYRKSETEEVV